MSHYSQSVSRYSSLVCAVYSRPSSLPSGYCDRLLFLPLEGYSGTRRDSSHPLYPELRFYVPCPGFRIYMRTERKFISYVIALHVHPPLQLFPIFNEISSNTQKRMNIVIGTSIGSAAMIYEIIAVFGYLTFGSKVPTLVTYETLC